MKSLTQISLSLFLTGLLLVTGCRDENPGEFAVPVGITDFFDDFETDTRDINTLFPSDNSRWTNLQQDNPTDNENEVELTDIQAATGDQSLRFFAYGSLAPLSKMDIEKAGFAAVAGQTVTIEADFFIDSEENLADLLLLDFECCSCWDPNVPDNNCPGVRLMMSGGNDFLSIERGKIGGETLIQSAVAFPRRQWVHITWEMTLSGEEITGRNVLTINDTEIIRSNGMNLPNAEVFAAAAQAEGIDFTLREPVFYERLQVGATANPTNADVLLYVDNVRVVVRD